MGRWIINQAAKYFVWKKKNKIEKEIQFTRSKTKTVQTNERCGGSSFGQKIERELG